MIKMHSLSDVKMTGNAGLAGLANSSLRGLTAQNFAACASDLLFSCWIVTAAALLDRIMRSDDVVALVFATAAVVFPDKPKETKSQLTSADHEKILEDLLSNKPVSVADILSLAFCRSTLTVQFVARLHHPPAQKLMAQCAPRCVVSFFCSRTSSRRRTLSTSASPSSARRTCCSTWTCSGSSCSKRAGAVKLSVSACLKQL
jgi:hypothetical protein